jgi:hypothetical protein
MTTTLPLTIVVDPGDNGGASVFVDVEINGHALPFLLDTGAAGSRRIEEVPRRTTGNPESSRLSLRDSRGFVNFEN